MWQLTTELGMNKSVVWNHFSYILADIVAKYLFAICAKLFLFCIQLLFYS